MNQLVAEVNTWMSLIGLSGIHYHSSLLRIYRMCLAFTRLELTTSLVESTASREWYMLDHQHVVMSKEAMSQVYQSLCSRRILLAQQLIKFKDYFRVFCFDKRHVLFIKWIPKPFAMGHYLDLDGSVPVNVNYDLTEMTMKLNEALDLDVNVVEWCVDEEGRWWVIDAFNEVPDVTPEALPSRYYTWIVDTLALCIRDKLDSGKSNRLPFH